MDANGHRWGVIKRKRKWYHWINQVVSSIALFIKSCRLLTEMNAMAKLQAKLIQEQGEELGNKFFFLNGIMNSHYLR